MTPTNANTFRLVVKAVAAIALAATLLSACSTATTPTASSTTTPSAPPSATPTAPAVVASRVGQVVTAAEVVGLPKGQRAYTMADGSLVVTQKDQPLPLAVLADIKAPVVAITKTETEAPTSPTDGSTPVASLTSIAATRAAAEAAQKTGRQVIIVYRGFGGQIGDPSGRYQWLWTTTRGASLAAIPNKAAKVAEVQAYIAAAADPSIYDLIVLD